MPLESLQHVNIRCADARASRNFYVEVIGLTEGPRPPFPFPGHWLYLGDVPVIHLVQKPDGEARRGPGTGEIDHIAFGGGDLEGMRARLVARGLSYQEKIVPRDGVIQLFLHDPEGVKLELNFPTRQAGMCS
ncbi:MAG TPA: VOC family protein [Rhizomicrobium sp.]|jgi:catechol 2,3-dioxygenase-like lactoylglutathione lyase family enzyme|nr:VOC family protein [Rhizomicrobium sp.]